MVQVNGLLQGGGRKAMRCNNFRPPGINNLSQPHLLPQRAETTLKTSKEWYVAPTGSYRRHGI